MVAGCLREWIAGGLSVSDHTLNIISTVVVAAGFLYQLWRDYGVTTVSAQGGQGFLRRNWTLVVAILGIIFLVWLNLGQRTFTQSDVDAEIRDAVAAAIRDAIGKGELFSKAAYEALGAKLKADYETIGSLTSKLADSQSAMDRLSADLQNAQDRANRLNGELVRARSARPAQNLDLMSKLTEVTRERNRLQIALTDAGTNQEIENLLTAIGHPEAWKSVSQEILPSLLDEGMVGPTGGGQVRVPWPAWTVLIKSTPDNSTLIPILSRIWARAHFNVQPLQAPDPTILDSPVLPVSNETGIIIHGDELFSKMMAVFSRCFKIYSYTKEVPGLRQFYHITNQHVVYVEINGYPWRTTKGCVPLP